MLAPTRQAEGTARFGAIAPPMLGWNTRDPVPSLKEGFAPILDNWTIEAGVPRLRRGYRVWSTGLPGRVDGLLPWSGAGTSQQLFAASGTAIYNCTTAGAVGAAVVTGLTSARVSSIMVSASGGNFLFAFNGVDTPQTYNGTTWAAWTGTGVTGGVSWAGQFKGRVFVGNSGRLSFFYGGAGAIAGAFTEFPLQAIATRGGGVCAMASLAAEGGNGPQDLVAFMTTEGEVIVYGGTDPSSASTWGLVGRWQLPRPIGAPQRCLLQYGGDVLAVTEGGVLPLSAFRSGEDPAVLAERYGTTRKILPTWRGYAADRAGSAGWGIAALNRLSLVVVNVPWSATTAQQVVVSEGGALSRWISIPAACWAEALGGRAFFGDSTATGRVMLYGEDVADAGRGIQAEAATAFITMGAPGRMKRVRLVQPVMKDSTNASVSVSMLTNWQMPIALADAAGPSIPSPPLPSASTTGVFTWNVSLWNSAVWAGADNTITLPWRGARSYGQAHAARLVVIGGVSRPAWMGSNITFDAGGITR